MSGGTPERVRGAAGMGRKGCMAGLLLGVVDGLVVALAVSDDAVADGNKAVAFFVSF